MEERQRLALRLPTNSRTTAGIPVCRRLLKAASGQVLREPDQVFLRIFHTLVVSERSNLMEEICEKRFCLNLTKLKVQLLTEKAQHGLDYFGLFFLGQRDGH